TPHPLPPLIPPPPPPPPPPHPLPPPPSPPHSLCFSFLVRHRWHSSRDPLRLSLPLCKEELHPLNEENLQRLRASSEHEVYPGERARYEVYIYIYIKHITY